MSRGIIQQSESEYSAPTTVVNQPHHPTTPRRMVHDYRKLNEKTVHPPYPMPIMEDVIDNITREGSKYFTAFRTFLLFKVGAFDSTSEAGGHPQNGVRDT